MSLDIICLFKEVLEKELTKKPELMVLPEKSLHELLAPSRQSGENEDVSRKGIFGYPSRPLYKDLGEKFKIWMETGKCPIEELPNFELLDEKDYVNERLEKMCQITPILEKLKSLHDLLSRDEISFYMREIIKVLVQLILHFISKIFKVLSN
ncbi:hypothetical protein HELRODRAFT_166677 [Helobdella robusta]|uniref:Uncharacterized protein n=1 Tax=Helobdella robusta TaxID=6412 RepID=T1EYC5_HELRO|nr:hypothetical protein HELRODRAFT_166677 [Helobdella robusta]ESO11663.1 hypothetical protein HELRODRAFT_166677 [Helobdella robusta]